MQEQLTWELIELHLSTAITVVGKVQGDGVERFAWDFNWDSGCEEFPQPPFDDAPRPGTVGSLTEFKYRSNDAAWNYAMGWIRRSRPHWWDAAKREAEEGIRYRASQRKKA